MRCPECNQTYKTLDSRIFDFTTRTLGCPRTGDWPEYSAKVYIDNVNLLVCPCGVTPEVPELEELKQGLLGASPPGTNSSPIDPFSGLVYMGTWDDEEGWIISQHQEQ
jgi:hypothetical protein